ncbi:MAG TPA: hypothetical protein VHZ01_06205 [Casimicrobiaceae bacterium]|jgi:hypothetical protein|nr:hypothetical protein [Casimicrobiaceae bacterium]
MNSPSESVFHFMTLSFFDDYSLLGARLQPRLAAGVANDGGSRWRNPFVARNGVSDE